jgi:preprotein translocase subunit SecG
MVTIFYGLHIALCLVLLVVILLQQGKGSGVGLSIGGGMGQTMFGGSGGKTFFLKLTTTLGAIFFALSLGLAWNASKTANSYKGVLNRGAEAPASVPVAPAPVEPVQPASRGAEPVAPVKVDPAKSAPETK